MDDLQIKDNWNKKKGKLLQKYAGLTEKDLQYSEGKEEELIGRIRDKTGKSKEEVRRMIQEA